MGIGAGPTHMHQMLSQLINVMTVTSHLRHM